MKSKYMLALSMSCCLLIALATQAVDRKTKPNISNLAIAKSYSVGSTQIQQQFNGSYSVSLAGGPSVSLKPRYEIKLRTHSFDPLTKDPQQSLDLSLVAPFALGVDVDSQIEQSYIVQFHTQAFPDYQTELKNRGATVLGSLPDQALIVKMRGAVKTQVQALPYVRWIGAYHPAYKLDSSLHPAVRVTTDITRMDKYGILVFTPEMQQQLSEFIADIGGEVTTRTKSSRFEAALNDYQLLQVVRHADVMFIDRVTAIEDDLDLVREHLGANFLETVRGYTGQGVAGEVIDSGVNLNHVEFQGQILLSSPSATTSQGGHGNLVAGVVFAAGISPQHRSILPDAARKVVASRHSLFPGGASGATGPLRRAHAEKIIDPNGPFRVVFQTSSWGNARTTDYTTVSAELDEILFDLDYVRTQSQSNAGARPSRPEAWTKNGVSVGGIHMAETLSTSDDFWRDASIGPASDGRIKPDLSAQYGGIATASVDGAYSTLGGTSGATPVTAGYFGLMFQMWADGVFDGGPGKNRDVFGFRPHAATAKALMVHSAFQYTFSGQNHNLTRTHQGWGLPDVKNLHENAKATGWVLPVLIDESAPIAPTQIHTYPLFSDASKPIKATLVYRDPKGNPGAARHRINDLSLRVTSPTGVIYWGNNGLLEGNWSTPGGSSNHVDTVENVFVQNPVSGGWTVEVVAEEIVEDGNPATAQIDAVYALVVTGGTAEDLPPAAPANVTATAGDKAIALDWSDNNEGDFASYSVNRSTVSGGPYTPIASGLTTSAFIDTGLTNGTAHFYVLNAVDNAGQVSANSAEVTATPAPDTTPPAAPTGLVAAAGNALVDLDWNDNTESDFGSYTVKRATFAAGPFVDIATGLVQSHFTDNTAVNGTTYHYVVSAVDISGNESARSSAVTATPVANNAPRFNQSTITKPSVEEGVNFSGSLTGDASDPDGDPITFSKVSGPAWLQVAADGGLSGIARPFGLSRFTVRVTDSGGLFGEATLEINVIQD